MTNPAYFVIEVEIVDSEGIRPYQAKVAETYQAFGGERVVAGADAHALEGIPPTGKLFMLRFPSMAMAQAWHDSPAYQAILGYRLASAKSRAFFIEGLA